MEPGNLSAPLKFVGTLDLGIPCLAMANRPMFGSNEPWVGSLGAAWSGPGQASAQIESKKNGVCEGFDTVIASPKYSGPALEVMPVTIRSTAALEAIY